MRRIPLNLRTPCPALNAAWDTYAHDLLTKPGFLIPDTEDDLNFHAFLGHSVDMQGFRAGEFVGVDSMSSASSFVPLQRIGIGVMQLATLWDVTPIREYLLAATRRGGKTSVESTCAVLAAHGGSFGQLLCTALMSFPMRKQNRIIRALLQNSAALKTYEHSFRSWLQVQCEDLGVRQFPPSDFRVDVWLGTRMPLENALRVRLRRDFYLVADQMAPYMMCDWQLWLWNEGKASLSESFKLDAFHQEFVETHGRNIIPADEQSFIHWWHSQPDCADVPPRLANECIWLYMESSKKQSRSSCEL